MMKRRGREILIPVREDSRGKVDVEKELAFLDELLKETEELPNLIAAYDLIDTHKRKVYVSGRKLKLSLNNREMIPFLFLFNLN